MSDVIEGWIGGERNGGFVAKCNFANLWIKGEATVGDLMKWNAFLDAPSVLGAAGPAVVQAMTTPMTLNSGHHITYALGLDVTARDGMREISHSGSTAGYRTWLARYPDEHASVAVLCNAGGGANAVGLGTTATLALLGRQQRPLA